MRQLSVVELELVIGGYDGGGGQISSDIVGDYGYGDSAMSISADGQVSGNLAAADFEAVTAGVRIDIPGFKIPVEIGKFKIEIPTPPVHINMSGKKR